MKSLSVEMACLLGIQKEIQAVCMYYREMMTRLWVSLTILQANATPLICFLIYVLVSVKGSVIKLCFFPLIYFFALAWTCISN